MNNNSLLSHRKEEPENGILYIVGTPIGNLNDISQRALNILKNVSLVACEDTRQTRKIMNKFNISNKLISFNKHNSSIKIPKIIKDLKDGKSIAIVSDAGMPGICDPGEDIARSVKSEGIDLLVIDSVAALVPRAELEGEMGDSLPGLQARLMSQALRKLTSSISKTNTMVVF